MHISKEKKKKRKGETGRIQGKEERKMELLTRKNTKFKRISPLKNTESHPLSPQGPQVLKRITKVKT